MVRRTDCPAMTIAVDLGRKATKQKNELFANIETTPSGTNIHHNLENYSFDPLKYSQTSII